MNWFPIRLAAFSGGVLLLACPILDFIIGSPAFIQAFIYVYLLCISIASFVFSRMAGRKFARLREFIAAGSEGDQMVGRFMRKFDELDKGGKEGTIGSAEIVKVMEQAGRTISNSERHALQTFLDESCNGYVSKEDWMKQLVTQYEGKTFKQKF